jgi:methyl-accepting chemotaxis protein
MIQIPKSEYETLKKLEAQLEIARDVKNSCEKQIYWLRSILDALPIPISVTNTKLEWTLVNRIVEQMLNVKRENILGKHCSNWGAHICNTENCGIYCLQHGKNETFFSQFGREFNVVVAKLHDKDGNHTGYIESVRDITEIVEKSAQMERDAFWYKSILDTIPFPISVTNLDMQWTFLNKSAENILGKSFEELEGQHCSNWGADICNTENCGIYRAKQGMSNAQFWQNDRCYYVDVAVLKDKNGQDVGYIEMVMDVTPISNEELDQLMNEL